MVRARDRVEQGDEASGNVRPERLTADELGSARWSAHSIQDSNTGIIGGYQVCHKWLKDRKGRTLSDEDIAHYQKIVVALSETIHIMAEIDEVIEAHGGCLDAFQTKAATRSSLACCLTVHKTQGSEFGATFVVLTNPYWLLSRELLYTALTATRTGWSSCTRTRWARWRPRRSSFQTTSPSALPQGAHAAVESRSVVAYAGREVVVEVGRGVDALGPPGVALQVQRLGALRL